MAKRYDAKDITVLEGLDPVRRRPGMYIGGTGKDGLHHLVWEILDNSIDEAMNGHATEIAVELHPSLRIVTITDNGRGIPVDRHPRAKKPAIEVILTTLHAGGKFGDAVYRTSGGLHGVGASVVNALSSSLVAQVRRGGALFRVEFSRGKVKVPLKKIGAAKGSGTRISFEPDSKIFPRCELDPALIEERLLVASYLHRGVKFHFAVGKEKRSFHHERGVEAFVERLVKERELKRTHEELFTLKLEDEIEGELALCWTDATDERIRSYVNGIPTGSGGTHENGLRAGIGKAVRNYLETHDLQPKGVSIGTEDIREGVVGVLSVFVKEPQFQGQTKDRLNNPEVQAPVDGAIRQGLEHWLNNHRSMAEAVVMRIVQAARARAASRDASLQVRRKSAARSRINLPGKLYDCSKGAREDSEIFIVEGDSAGGSAKQARDPTTQAILPLRGKVLNTEGLGLSKLLQNKEISDLVTALGCGIGKDLDLARLRYGRVILLADADSDGHHITTLLLTFFFRHLRPLVEEGRLYIARTPLFRVDIGKQTHWAKDEADRDRILKENSNRGKVQITRFKGLGEMPAKILKETTLDPARRILDQVRIEDALAADGTFAELMGKDASARFDFIMNRAETAELLDL